MFGKKMLWLGLMLNSLICYGAGETETNNELDQTNDIPYSPPSFLSSLPKGDWMLLVSLGIVAFPIVFIVLVAGSLLAFAYGFRLCHIIGNCPDTSPQQGYSVTPSGYEDQQGYQQETYNNPVYQMRSLEYVGPILKMIGSAYEKYSRSGDSN